LLSIVSLLSKKLIGKTHSPQRRGANRENAEKKDEKSNERNRGLRNGKRRKSLSPFLLLSANTLCALCLCGEWALNP
jgi:hypothetical protein